MTKDQIIAWATRHGFTKDKFGHYQKTYENTGNKYRIKIQATSVRYEKQITLESYYGKCSHRWANVQSGYLKDACLTQDDKLKFSK